MTKRADDLAKMVGCAINGKPDSLVCELEAMVSFLRTWETDFGEEDDPRMACITGMVADLASMICLGVLATTPTAVATKAAAE